MKRLIATFPDDAKIDLGALASVALDLRIERVEDPKKMNGSRITRHAPAGNSIQKVIMDHYTPSGLFYSDDAQKWITAAHYNPASHSPAVSVLVSTGYLSTVGKGKFQFVKPFKQDQLKA